MNRESTLSSFYRDNLPVSETKGVKVSLEMKDYLADFIVGVYKEAQLQRLYPWQVSLHLFPHSKSKFSSSLPSGAAKSLRRGECVERSRYHS